MFDICDLADGAGFTGCFYFLIQSASLYFDKYSDGKIYIYRVSQEERTKLREGVPNVKLYRYNPKHVCPKLNGYGDNGQRSLKLCSCYTLTDYQIHIETGRNIWFM